MGKRADMGKVHDDGAGYPRAPQFTPTPNAITCRASVGQNLEIPRQSEGSASDRRRTTHGLFGYKPAHIDKIGSRTGNAKIVGRVGPLGRDRS